MDRILALGSGWIRLHSMDSTALALAVSALAAAVVARYLWAHRSRRGCLPPGPWPLPVVGNLLSIGSSQAGLGNYIRAARKRFGDVFTIHVGSLPVVIVNGRDAIREALVKNGDKCCARYPISTLLTFLSDKPEGLVLTPHWKEQRRFLLERMREHGVGREGLESKVHEELAALLGELDGASTGGRACDVGDYTKPAIANIMFNIVFGRRFEYDDRRFVHLLHLLDEFLSQVREADAAIYLPMLRRLPGKWQHIRSLRQPMLTALGGLIDEQRAAAAAGTAQSSYVDSYLKAMGRDGAATAGFTETDLPCSVLSLFGAGTDTTDASLKWVLLYCLVNPDVQLRLQEEIDEKIGRQRYPSVLDRQHMPYTEAVLTEVLRLAAPAVQSLAYSVTDAMTVCGLPIPPGSILVANLDSTTNDEAAFPQAHRFKPERHLDSEGRFVRPECMLPFSIGRRSCPGETLARMQLFLFVTSILQRYTICLPEGQETPAIRQREDSTVFSPRSFTCRLLRRGDSESGVS